MRRVPIAEYRNALKNIIECFEGKQSKKVRLDMLGVTQEELQQVVEDNTSQNLKAMIDDLKSRFMIEDEALMSVQVATSYSLKQFTGSRAKAARTKTDERNYGENEQESDSLDEEEGLAIPLNDL